MNATSIERETSGIAEIAATLNPSEGDGDYRYMIVDLDDTTIEARRHLWSDGVRRKVLPETVAAFMALDKAGVCLGVTTEQAFTEIEPRLTDIATLALGPEQNDPYSLFKGPMMGEGGNVVRRGVGQRTGKLVMLVSKQALHDRTLLLDWFRENIILAGEDELAQAGWGVLNGVDPEVGTWVMLPPDNYQGVATISIWERGPHISDNPTYISRYEVVGDTLRQAMQELGIQTLRAYEAGNGTHRIVSRRRDKAKSMLLLAGLKALNLKHMVYACDGPNDVGLAQVLSERGGKVIAVANAVLELHKIADYLASQPAGLGFAEAVSVIFPDQYQQTWEDLTVRRGLYLVAA